MSCEELKGRIINCHDTNKLRKLHAHIDSMLALTAFEKTHLKEQIVERIQFLEEHEENAFLGALRTIYSPEYKDVIETQKKLVRRLKSNLKSDKQDESCEVAIQAAMEVIGKACREGKVEVHMGYPKESCRGFLLNVGDLLEEKFFAKSKSKLNIESIDTDVFNIKRTPLREGLICEGRVRFVYLSNKGMIDIEGLKLEWRQLNALMKGAGISLLLTLAKQMYHGGARILNIEIEDVIVSSDPGQREQADVDLLMKITVSISEKDMEIEEYEPPETSVEVMHGRQAESIEQIIKDMHTAYEKGIDKYILVADNGEKVILNVLGVMREPREDNFENVLKGYINRLLIHPEEG